MSVNTTGKYFYQWILPKDETGKEMENFNNFDRQLHEIKYANTAEGCIDLLDAGLEANQEGKRPVGYRIFSYVCERLDVNIENTPKKTR
jgi:hypothetical protein